jgi:hypothetical protein
MCCFSRPVPFVAGTKIFARSDASGAELLAYSMDADVPEELAMVLPLPVPPAPAEDAVAFVDLEGYPELFEDLARAFPPIFVAPQAKRLGPALPRPATLKVHDVGLFEASFVPTTRDFARLDPRFRLDDRVWRALPAYADWGFAVFRLKPRARMLGLGIKRQTFHPMALQFPRRDPSRIFFPTVHVHDGEVHDVASFDHLLYVQADPVIEATLSWTESTAPLGAHVDAARARGLVDGARGGFATPLWGPLANEDVWLVTPEGVRAEDLAGRGASFSYRVRATFAQRLPSSRASDGSEHARRTARWAETAAGRLGPLSRNLGPALRALESANGAAWRLAPLTPDLAPHFVNGNALWRGDDWQGGGGPGTAGERGRLRFRPFSDRIEPQDITLGFEALPGPELLGEIDRALAALAERAAFGATG